jgi:ABC-type multidrug transport system, ATPase and permease components
MNKQISEDGLERYEEYLHTYSTNKNHPLIIIASFYKGNAFPMIKACFFLIVQRSPVWVIPIVTANIIDTATDPDGNFLREIIINLLIAMIFLFQDIASSFMATQLYSRVNRSIEGSLRNALVRKLQYLSIMFHKEMQTGRRLASGKYYIRT